METWSHGNFVLSLRMDSNHNGFIVGNSVEAWKSGKPGPEGACHVDMEAPMTDRSKGRCSCFYGWNFQDFWHSLSQLQQIPEDVKELARALHRAELQSTSPGQDAIIEHLGAMARGGGDVGALGHD